MLINKTQLSNTTRKYIKTLENRLGVKCYEIWDFINPKNEYIIFGRFGKKKNCDIITLAYRHKCGLLLTTN